MADAPNTQQAQGTEAAAEPTIEQIAARLTGKPVETPGGEPAAGAEGAGGAGVAEGDGKPAEGDQAPAGGQEAGGDAQAGQARDTDGKFTGKAAGARTRMVELAQDIHVNEMEAWRHDCIIAEATGAPVPPAPWNDDLTQYRGDPVEHIKRLTARKTHATQKAASSKATADSLRGKKADDPAAAGKPPPYDGSDPADPLPKYDDFDTAELYYQAMSDHAARKGRRMYERDQQQASERLTFENEQRRLGESFAAKIEAVKGEHPEILEALERVEAQLGEIPNPAHLRAALVTSEHSALLALELDRDPGILSRIAQLDPISQVRELGRLEARIAPNPEANAGAPASTTGNGVANNTAAKPPAKPVSRAPAPPKPIGTQGTVAKSVNEMSVQELARLVNKRR